VRLARGVALVGVTLSSQIASGNRFLTLAMEIVALSTANDLVKLQNVVSHADQRPLTSYFLQPA
jgi:hypothetical protein